MLNIPKWQILQDSLALATGLAIITVDYMGTPITKHSNQRLFCQQVRKDSSLEKNCQKCDSRGGLEAVRLGKPYAYLCHCNILDVATPIIIEEKYAGAVMAGEIKISNEYNPNLEKILYNSDSDRFISFNPSLYQKIPTISIHEMQYSIDMIFSTLTYIIDESLSKLSIIDRYKKANTHTEQNFSDNTTLFISSDLKKDKNNSARAVSLELEDSVTCSNHTLQPAFEYLLEHRSEMLTQKKAAVICHISSGHFSRLFTKKMGENFTSYYTNLKINWAKELLDKTDMNITQISDELGFSEPGYFIKMFKKYEGTTPAVYRKLQQPLI